MIFTIQYTALFKKCDQRSSFTPSSHISSLNVWQLVLQGGDRYLLGDDLGGMHVTGYLTPGTHLVPKLYTYINTNINL